MRKNSFKISTRLTAILTCIVLSLVFTKEGEAQLRYGFRFGGDFASASLGNNSDLEGPPSVYTGAALKEVRLDNRSAFSGGLMLEYQFEKCGFAPDIAVLYTRYNTRIIPPDEKPKSLGRNFIEIPLHLKWKFWIPQTKNLFAPMIYTGPSVMFRLGHDDGYIYRGIYGPDYSGAQFTDFMPTQFKTRTVQAGWDLGIGFDIVNFIQLTAGYRFGLGNALSSPSHMTLRTNAWNLSANILFDF